MSSEGGRSDFAFFVSMGTLALLSTAVTNGIFFVSGGGNEPVE
jgi:hypothetical protein